MAAVRCRRDRITVSRPSHVGDPSAFGSPATSMSSIWPFGCGAKKTLGTGTSGGGPSTSNSSQTLSTAWYSGEEGSAQRTAKSSTRLHTGSVIRRAGSVLVGWSPARLLRPQDALASTQKSARGAFSPRRHSKPNVLWARVAGSTRATEFMSEKADGEINAGGTLAAIGLRYSSNELDLRHPRRSAAWPDP